MVRIGIFNKGIDMNDSLIIIRVNFLWVELLNGKADRDN